MTAARSAIYLCRGAIAAAVIAPFWFWKGGVLELEVLQFITQYLDGRSVLQKVFDPYKNDFNTYQAREFSYFLDFLDAQVFKRLMSLDIVSFIPMTAVIASALTVAVFLLSVRKYRTLPVLTAGLLLLIYLTNYIHLVTMGVFYRATKPLLAPILMATTFYLATLLTREKPADSSSAGRARRWLPPAAVFGLFCLMSALDRQGFFYSALGFAVLTGATLLDRSRWPLALAAFAAVGCMLAYNYQIGPAIVSSINGYVPNLNYQNYKDVPPEQLHQGLKVYAHAGELLLESLSVMMGGVPRIIAGLVIAGLAVAGVLSGRSRLVAITTLVLLLVSQVAMFAMMIVRHPPLYDWIDHRYWYYPLPFQALVLALGVMLLARILSRLHGWRVVVVNLALAAIVVSNVAHWPMYRDRMLTSRWFSRIYPQTALLRSSIAQGEPDPRLIKQYREFYALCTTLLPQQVQPAPAAGREP